MNNSEIILEFLGKHYQSGEWIYPNVVKAKTHSSMKNVCEILEKCCKAGMVEKVINIYCTACCQFITVYKMI